MLGMLLVPAAILEELEPLLGILFVLCRRVIFPFTLGTDQRHYLLHKPLQTHKPSPLPYFRKKIESGII